MGASSIPTEPNMNAATRIELIRNLITAQEQTAAINGGRTNAQGRWTKEALTRRNRYFELLAEALKASEVTGNESRVDRGGFIELADGVLLFTEF